MRLAWMEPIDRLEAVMRAMWPNNGTFVYHGPAKEELSAYETKWTARAKFEGARVPSQKVIGTITQKHAAHGATPPTQSECIAALLRVAERYARERVAAITAALGEESSAP